MNTESDRNARTALRRQPPLLLALINQRRSQRAPRQAGDEQCIPRARSGYADEHYIAEWTAMLASRVEALR